MPAAATDTEWPTGTSMRPPIWEWDHFDLSTLGLFGRPLWIMEIDCCYSRCLKEKSPHGFGWFDSTRSIDSCFHCYSGFAVEHWRRLGCHLGRSSCPGYATASWKTVAAAYCWKSTQRRPRDYSKSCAKLAIWPAVSDPIWCSMVSCQSEKMRFSADLSPKCCCLYCLMKTGCLSCAQACYYTAVYLLESFRWFPHSAWTTGSSSRAMLSPSSCYCWISKVMQ